MRYPSSPELSPPSRTRPVRRRPLPAVALLGMLLALGARAQDGATDAAAPPPEAVPGYRQASNVAVLTIEGVIDHVTLTSLERRVAEAKANGADAIVFDIDTPGGDALATLDICHLIKTDAPANSVAWINPQGYSAGTIIALACREIVVAPHSAFGDAAPIDAFGRQLLPTERAKAESPILAEVIDSARRNHYDENLVQAFISVGVELWLIEHETTGQRIFVDRAEYETVFGEEPPQLKIDTAPPDTSPTFTPWFSPFGEQGAPREDAGLSEEEKRKEIEFAQDLPPTRERLTEEDRGQWELVQQLIGADSLLVLNEHEAVYYGVAQRVVANDTQLQEFFGTTTPVTHYDQSWSESMVRFLTNPIVRGVLILIFVICLLIELSAPGMGVFGATAMVALLILIGAPVLAGMAGWWEIIAIIAGFLLIGAEIFVIPGFGLAGIAGGLCLAVGVIATFVSHDVRTAQGQEDLAWGMGSTLAAVFAAGVVLWFLSKNFERMPFLRRLILQTELTGEAGGAGGALETETASVGILEAMGAAQRAVSVGDSGTATTDLRPAGRAQIDGRSVDVKSIGAYIDRGTPIRVVSVGRFVIEVEDA